ncbi:hypothetical protein NUW54_g7457 [Trametes sanguinea]|uniref:Uncharacterized protein n=1 Tax=Trametes sanguinea TaxID=158606 RepID=A0ACC1PKD2_9APHY|nr:hypothetical protein NUW54_g7457 [Trametes sanguinea]
MKHLSKGWPAEDEAGSDKLKQDAALQGPKKGRQGQGTKSEEITQYSVRAYIEVELYQEVKKSTRGMKKLEGSFGAAALKEDLVVASLCWKFAPTLSEKGPKFVDGTFLPLTSKAGFEAFVKDGVLATQGTRNFIFRMAPPISSPPNVPWVSMTNRALSWTAPGHATALEDDSDASDDEGTGMKRKGKAKGKSVDAVLAPIVEKLKKIHPVGRCPFHPGMRCFYHGGLERHFELDNNRLLVWAASIDKGDDGVDYNHIPLHSHFFQVDQALKVPLASAHGHPPGVRVPEGSAHVAAPAQPIPMHAPVMAPMGPPMVFPAPAPVMYPPMAFCGPAGGFPGAPYGMTTYYPQVMAPQAAPVSYYPAPGPSTMAQGPVGHAQYPPDPSVAGLPGTTRS